MKKILALILCLSVVLTSFGGIVFAQEETAEQVVFSDEFLADYDEAKGLLDMLFGEKVYQDGLVTRGDFVVSLFKLLKLDTMAVEDAFFKDVSKRDEQAPYIYTAVRLGWVSKAQNFEPGRVITPNEALKILCCAMNYGFIANNKGGYPGGYQYVANKLDLLDNLELKGTELDSKNAYVLLFNAVTAPTLEQISFGDTEEYDSTGKSLLYSSHDIYIVEGVVTRTLYNTITGSDIDGIGDLIEIEGETYIGVDGCSSYDILGRSARAYVVDNPSGKDTVIYLHDVSQEKLEIKLIDLGDTKTNAIEYWTNDGSKKRTAKLKNGCAYLLNGRKITSGIDKALTAGAGKVVLTDNEGDGYYDVVSIERYSYISVKSYDPLSESLRDENSADFTIDLSDAIVKLTNLDGEAAEVIDIAAGNLYRVLQSEDGFYIELTQIEGTEVIGYNNGVEGANVIIGRDYYIMSDYYKSISKSKIKDANQYTFIVDNDIVISATEETGTVVYGYALGTDWTGGMETGLEMKVYTSSGKFEVYPVREKLMIDGENGKKNSDLHRLIGDKAQLIRYSVNSKNEVNMVDTVSTEEPKELGNYEDSNNTLTKFEALSKLNLRYYSNPKTMGARYSIASSIIFQIPEDLSDEDEYAIMGAQNLTNNEPYTFEVYTINSSGDAEALIVYAKDDASIFLPHCDTAAMVIKSVDRAMDDEGNEVYKIYGFKGNTFTTLYLPIDFKVTKAYGGGKVVNSVHPVLSSGDMIAVAIDANNEIQSMKILFDARDGAFMVNSGGAVSNPDGANNWSLLNGMVYDVKGTTVSYSIVKDENGNYDFSPANLRYATINTANMCHYNCENTQIRNIDASTVKTYKADGDDAYYIAIQANYYLPRMIAFYENAEVR